MSKEKGRQPPRSVPGHWGGSPDPEDLDPTPVEMPLGACRPTPLAELIARAVHQELQNREEEGVESWDEANDFEYEGDEELLDMSPYELKELEAFQEGFEVHEPPSEPEQPEQAQPEQEGDEPSE